MTIRSREPGLFARKLTRLRNEARLKREELAARAGLSADLIQSLEQGRVNNPKLQTLLGLSRALEITIGELVEGVEETERQPGRGAGGSSVPITNNSEVVTDLCKIWGFKIGEEDSTPWAINPRLNTSV